MDLIKKWTSLIDIPWSRPELLMGINNTIHLCISLEAQCNVLNEPYRKYALISIRGLYSKFNVLYKNISDDTYKLSDNLRGKCIDHILLVNDPVDIYDFSNRYSTLCEFEALIGYEAIIRKLTDEIFIKFSHIIYIYYEKHNIIPIFYINVINNTAYLYII